MYELRQNPNTVTWKLAVLLTSFSIVLHAAQDQATVIVNETFDGYITTEAMQSVWKNGTAELHISPPGGGKAALHDGGDLNSYSGLSVRPDATHNVVFSADFYDYATNSDKRVTALLKNGSGANLEFGLLNTYGPYCYRFVGFGTNSEWQPFAPDLQPVHGWHRFEAVVSLTNAVVTLDLGRDGKVDHSVCIEGRPPMKPFNMVRFGGLLGKVSHGGPVLVDNIRVAIVPVEQPVTVAQTPVAAVEPATPRPAPAPVAAAPAAVVAPVVMPDRRWGVAEWGIVAGLAVIILLLVVLIHLIRQHGKSTSRALVAVTRAPAMRLPVEGFSEATVSEEWRQRALTAETLADKQAQILREKMMPELAAFAKQSLVQGLVAQRNELIETQKQAAADLTALEERLATLHLPLQERIHAYETRITELEKEFESRGDEVRELTRATLALVRQRLDEERDKVRLGNRFN